jgi:hypothetical protein
MVPLPASPRQLPKKSENEWSQFQAVVQPFLAENCYECHGAKSPENNVRLDMLTNSLALAKERDLLRAACKKIQRGEMPPKDRPRPEATQETKVIGWFGHYLENDPANHSDPGRVTMRRLNRAEYNNTIRDLLGVDFRPADIFPADTPGNGFDNNGDALSIAPVMMEKYLSAASLALDKVIDAEPIAPPPLHRVDALAAAGNIPANSARRMPLLSQGTGSGGAGPTAPVGRLFAQKGELYDDYVFPRDGTYILRLRAYGVPGMTTRLRPIVSFAVDGKTIAEPTYIPYEFHNTGVTTFEPLKITAGPHRITLAFLNGTSGEDMAVETSQPAFTDPAGRADWAAPAPIALAGGMGGDQGPRNRGFRPGPRVPPGPSPSPTGKPMLGVIYFEVEGPSEITPERMPEYYNRLMFERPSATVTKLQAAQQIIRPFVARAFRRPPREDEAEQFIEFWTKVDARGHTFDESLALTLQAVLVSPQFLFRIESEAQPDEPGDVHLLSEYELASRLSYFLWSSMPDEELFHLAAERKLRASLPAQIRRMLHDRRSQALAENFAGQWLQFRRMESVAPNPALFPNFDDALRSAMVSETEMFFNSIVQEERSVFDFLDADYSFINERLARHYGLAGVTGDAFQRVRFRPDDHRGGLLTQASILTVTSYPDRTSPVQRGKWVLETLLDNPPPPPPPNAPSLAEPVPGERVSMRRRLEQHRADPHCATCHERMDPIGFGLENYNPVGAWRAKMPDGENIDASGRMPDGRAFNGPLELKKMLDSQKEKFAMTLTRKLLAYALGRGLTEHDQNTVETIQQSLRRNDFKFSVLVNEIVKSDPFQMRSKPPANQIVER